jgi:hypothetical protein
MFPRRRFTKEYPTHCRDYAETRKTTTATLSALQPKQHLSYEVYDKIAAVHNSSVGHWGQAKCRAKLNKPFTCASYNPFDAFSRWVELSPPRQRWHGNRHLAYFNIWDDSTHLNEKLFHGRCELSLTTAYSSEENGIVEGSNQEVLRHLNAILFDSRVHNKWSFEQLPMFQRIMNTVEKTST